VHKLWAVIRREFLTRVRSRAFVIGTVLGPLLILFFMVFPMLLERGQRKVARVVVVDASTGGLGERVADALRQATFARDGDSVPRYHVARLAAPRGPGRVVDSLVAMTDVRGANQESLDGILVITDDAMTSDTIRYLGSNAGSLSDMRALDRTLRQVVVAERLAEAGVDPGLLARTIRPVHLQTEKVTKGALTGASGEASFILAYIMAFLLYIALLIYGMQVMSSVVEEKTSRINEVLVSSLKPFQLLLGKVIGVGSAGLLQLGIWIGAGFLLTRNRFAIASQLGVSAPDVANLPIPTISADLVVVLLLFFFVGFFLYAAAYAAVGSMCSTIQETQQAAMPVTLVVAATFIAAFSLLQDPNGPLARVLSMVPLSAPVVIPVRYSQSPLGAAELLVSFALSVLGMLAVAWVAGRIYRIGILAYGKRPGLRELMRWVRTG